MHAGLSRARCRPFLAGLCCAIELSGLSQSVALPIIWRELHLRPFNHAWLVRAACFWNALASSQGFYKQIALDAVLLALQHHASNWVRGLCQALSVVGCYMQVDLATMPHIDTGEIRSCLSAQLAHA